MYGLLLVFALSCSGNDTPASLSSPEEEGEPLASALARIRASEPACMGPFSSVQVWRTTEGTIHRLFYSGDLNQCSHPPSAWYSPDGRLLEAVPMEPMTEENRAHYEAIWERNTTGAQKAESIPLFADALRD